MFLRSTDRPDEVATWSLTSPQTRLIQAIAGLRDLIYRFMQPWNDQRLAVIAWSPAARRIAVPIGCSAVRSISTVKRVAQKSVGTANPAEPLPAAAFRAATPLARTMTAHCNSCRRPPAVNAYISRTRDMAGCLQANHDCSHCDRQTKLAHLARPEIPCLIVVKRVGRLSQHIEAAGLNWSAGKRA